MVPGSAPGGSRSSSVLISVCRQPRDDCRGGVGGCRECHSQDGVRAGARAIGGLAGATYLQKQPSSYPALQALDLLVPLHLYRPNVSVQILGCVVIGAKLTARS